jgi:hypothetical protein
MTQHFYEGRRVKSIGASALVPPMAGRPPRQAQRQAETGADSVNTIRPGDSAGGGGK